MRRLLATALAIALIGGAYMYRERDSSTSDVLDLTCITELADVCRTLSGEHFNVTIEDAGVTADALTTGRTEMDSWLTTPAWVEMVQNAHVRAGKMKSDLESGSVIARSPLVLLGASNRIDVLRSACGGDLRWKCLGDAMGRAQWGALPGGSQAWGSVKVGWHDPGVSAVGLATLGMSTSSYFGRNTVDTLDLDDPGYGAWITAASRTLVRPYVSDTSVNSLLVTGPAAYGWIVTTEAKANTALKSAARSSEFTVVRPFTEASFDVVLASSTSAEIPRDAFTATGWQVISTDARGTSAATQPAPDGMPSADALAAIRNKWRQELSR